MIEFAYSSHIGTRDYQQDAVGAAVNNNGVTFGILCDGMGGLEDGGAASETAVESLSKSLASIPVDCNVPLFLNDQAHKLNKLIYTLPSKSGFNGASGTTLTCAVIIEDSLYWISAGDSRIYILRGDEIVAVTRDHNYGLELDAMVRNGTLTTEQAINDPKREALISFLGVEALELVDVNQSAFKLIDGDTVLLCSDGLYRTLSDDDILEIVNDNFEDLQECARVLPLHAFDRAESSCDNTSVVLLRYQHGEISR